MQLTNIRNCKKKNGGKKKKHYGLQKIDYNLTKQKYFECKIYIKLLHRKTHPKYILHFLQDQFR